MIQNVFICSFIHNANTIERLLCFSKNKNFKVFFFKKMVAIYIIYSVFLAFNNGTIVVL